MMAVLLIIGLAIYYLTVSGLVVYIGYRIYRFFTDEDPAPVPASEQLATVLLAVTASGALVAIPVTAGQIAPLGDSVTVEVLADSEGALDIRAPESPEEIQAVEDLRGKLEEAGHEVIVVEEDARRIVLEPDPGSSDPEPPPGRAPPADDEAEQRSGAIDSFAVF